MLFLIILILFLVLCFYVGSDTAREKGHDWLVIPILLIFFFATTVLSINLVLKIPIMPRDMIITMTERHDRSYYSQVRPDWLIGARDH